MPFYENAVTAKAGEGLLSYVYPLIYYYHYSFRNNFYIFETECLAIRGLAYILAFLFPGNLSTKKNGRMERTALQQCDVVIIQDFLLDWQIS